MTLRSVLPAVALSGLLVGSTVAADWPQWRGPNRDGKSADTGLLKEWPKGGPKLAWKLDDVGAGYGTPAVVGDRVYLVGAEGKKAGAKEFVLCVSAADGKQLWKTPIDTAEARFLDGWGGGPRGTPTVTAGKLFALGASGDLVCLNAANGSQLWAVNLVRDFGGSVPQWGYSESPLVDGNKVIVTPGGRPAGKGKKGGGEPAKPSAKSQGAVVALDAESGILVWGCKELTDPAGYSSFVVTTVGGVRVYVQQTMESGVGIAADSGKLLFKVGEIGRSVAVIPTPVVDGEGVFYTAGYGAGCEYYKLSSSGGGVKAEKVYSKNKVVANHHGGVIELGGKVYGHSDSNGWVCFDYKTGPDEPVWKNKGPGKGSIAYADGHFFCYSESKGELVRIKATPDGWEEAGKFTIPATSQLRKGTSGQIWPHPVVANGKLYLRDYELLFVYDLK
ncbi:MAG: PQQ-binding-like beta-propeller repeat protein [Gemmataceae bacterium]